VLPTQTGGFPFNLDGSFSTDATLRKGRRTWATVFWRFVQETTVTVFMRSSDPLIASIPKHTFQVQRPTGWVWNTTYRDAVVSACTATGCAMPFASGLDRSTPTSPKYVLKSLKPFVVDIHVVDANGQAVGGENDVVVEAFLLDNEANTVKLHHAHTPTMRGPVYVRARMGTARFNLTFSGDSGNTSTVRLAFRCPSRRPAALVNEWENADVNPCGGYQQMSSLPLRVISGRPPSSMWNDPNVQSRILIIKARSNHSSLEQAPWLAFPTEIALRLHQRGFAYIDELNTEDVVVSKPCTVDTGYFAVDYDLADTVCFPLPEGGLGCSMHDITRNTYNGSSTTSNTTAIDPYALVTAAPPIRTLREPARCPDAVFECLCPYHSEATGGARRQADDTLRQTMGRLLLQSINPGHTPRTPAPPPMNGTNSTNATETGNATRTQLEIEFKLIRASTFAAGTADEIGSAFDRLVEATIDMLINEAVFSDPTGYYIDPNSISTRTGADNLTTTAPEPVVLSAASRPPMLGAILALLAFMLMCL